MKQLLSLALALNAICGQAQNNVLLDQGFLEG